MLSRAKIEALSLGSGTSCVEGEVVAVSPAITAGELNDFLAAQGEGRMFPGGHHPHVGLGGFLLQGGMGWNAKVSELSLFGGCICL